jgi:competence protein ComEA
MLRPSPVRLSTILLLGGTALLAADNAPHRQDPGKNPGKKLVEEICSFCHGLAKLKGQTHTRDEWSSVIKGMVSEGAPVTDEEFSLILDYLAKNFGPEEQR